MTWLRPERCVLSSECPGFLPAATRSVDARAGGCAPRLCFPGERFPPEHRVAERSPAWRSKARASTRPLARGRAGWSFACTTRCLPRSSCPEGPPAAAGGRVARERPPLRRAPPRDAEGDLGAGGPEWAWRRWVSRCVCWFGVTTLCLYTQTIVGLQGQKLADPAAPPGGEASQALNHAAASPLDPLRLPTPAPGGPAGFCPAGVPTRADPGARAASAGPSSSRPRSSGTAARAQRGLTSVRPVRTSGCVTKLYQSNKCESCPGNCRSTPVAIATAGKGNRPAEAGETGGCFRQSANQRAVT